MKITLISDTHNKHSQITSSLSVPGGDLIIHAGDISSLGFKHEIQQFCKWFDSLSYDCKVFIAGNHDFGFEIRDEETQQILNSYKWITYLQDSDTLFGETPDSCVKIYGSPWSPRFHDWAFNADKGADIKQHWDKIPDDVDILVTHGPAFGILDTVEGRRDVHLGCEDLLQAIKRVKPKIHVCGHIHSGYGYRYSEETDTHHFNVAVLNEQYIYTQKPISFEWDVTQNKIEFI